MQERKQNRLRDYDYSRSGYYFVTVCTHDKIEWFGEIQGGTMVINDLGGIVAKQWIWLGEQYPYVQLDFSLGDAKSFPWDYRD